MTSLTPKYQLVTAESGDASDMPTYTAAENAAIEAALDRVLSQANAVANAKVAKAGDTMTGDLTVKTANDRSSVYLMTPRDGYTLGVDPTANGASIRYVDAAGAQRSTFMVFKTSGVTETVGNHDFRGEVWLYGTPKSGGGADINLNTGAVMRLASGKTVTFDKTAFALWLNLAPSTRRIKTAISPAHPTGILDVETVTYRYKTGVVDDNGATHLGVIAEQVAEVFPAAVVNDAEGRPEGVDVMALVAGLIATVKDQAARLAALEGNPR